MPRLTTPAAIPQEVLDAIETIGSRARTEILHVLAEQAATAPELANLLGAERTSIHHHLRRLEQLGVVAADAPLGKRTGRTVRWTLVPQRAQDLADQWVQYVTGRQ